MDIAVQAQRIIRLKDGKVVSDERVLPAAINEEKR